MIFDNYLFSRIFVSHSFFYFKSIVNDRNGKNQFRPKPKFRPSWPKVRPKVRPKLYSKMAQNYVKIGVLLPKNCTHKLGLFKNWNSKVCIWYNFNYLHSTFNENSTSNCFNKKNKRKNCQKIRQNDVFGYFGVSADWPKFRFRSYTINQFTLYWCNSRKSSFHGYLYNQSFIFYFCS